MSMLHLLLVFPLILLVLYIVKISNLSIKSTIFFAMTVFLGLVFMLIQYQEWSDISMAATSSSLMSSFYSLTGLHGSHVLVGLIWLLTIFFMTAAGKASILSSHIFIMSGIWYWHFVDLIWLFVYTFVYFWPTI